MFRTGLVAIGLALSLSPPVHGATVSVSSAKVVFAAESGEANVVHVALEALDPSTWAVTVTDQAGGLTVAEGCEGSTPTEALCTVVDEGPARLVIDLGDGDDRLTVAGHCEDFWIDYGYCVTVHGGPGDDHLVGTEEPDRLDGGEGNDVLRGRGGFPECDRRVGCINIESLRGGPGNDALLGGPGQDFLDGGSGADEISGGTGVDWTSYFDRKAGVRVTLDDRPDDGGPGEEDNVLSDVEAVTGGRGDDVLIGSARPNGLVGGPGADRIVGRGAGDTLWGEGGPDRLDGGRGNDVLRPSDGRDVVHGGPGADRISARDGWRDVLDGGSGFDRCLADVGLDYVARVERVWP